MRQKAFRALYNWLDVPFEKITARHILLFLQCRQVCKLPPLLQYDQWKAKYVLGPPHQFALVRQILFNTDHAEFWMPVETVGQFSAKWADTVMGMRWRTQEPVQFDIFITNLGPLHYQGIRQIREPFELHYPYNAGFGSSLLPFRLMQGEIPDGLELKWGFAYNSKTGFLWTHRCEHEQKFTQLLKEMKEHTAFQWAASQYDREWPGNVEQAQIRCCT